MSEEEKEAIETLKSDLEFCKSLRKRYRDEKQEKDYETILNYIERLQKELEEKTTILMAGADKVKQLEKENQELKEKIREFEIGRLGE